MVPHTSGKADVLAEVFDSKNKLVSPGEKISEELRGAPDEQQQWDPGIITVGDVKNGLASSLPLDQTS